MSGKTVLIGRAVFAARLLLLLALAGRGQAQEMPLLRLEPGGHTAQVRQVLWTSDESEILSVGEDKAVRVWDARSGREIATVRCQIGRGVEGELASAALAPGKATPLLALGQVGRGSDILLLDLAKRQVTRRLTGHKFAVTGLAFTPDGSRLASAGADGTVRLWDVAGGRALWSKSVVAGGVRSYAYAVAVSPDGTRIAGATQDGTVQVWDDGGKEVAKTRAGAAALCLAWSRQGTLAFGGRDGVIHLWQPATGTDETLPRQPDTVTCLAFSPDGQRLVSGGGEAGTDFKARVWSVPERSVTAAFTGHTTSIFAAAFSPTGAQIATADALGTIALWDPASGALSRQLKGTGGPAWSVAWSPDGKAVAWGTDYMGPLSRGFDLYNARPLSPLPDTGRWVRGAQAQDQRRLSVEADGATVFVRSNDGREIARIPAQAGDQVKCCAFTPDGRVVVGSDLYLAVWDVSGQPARTRLLEGHQGSVLAISVSPDGKYLASASADETVRIWSLADPGHDFGGEKSVVEPLLSLYQGGDDEWVAWNDHWGYYAASPAGDDIIGWQVNRGPDRVADFYPAYQFRQRFYHPDIISRLLEAGSVEGAVQMVRNLPAAPAALAPPTAPVDLTRTIPGEAAGLPLVEVVGVEAARPQPTGYASSASHVRVHVRVTNAGAGDVTVVFHVGRAAASRRLQEVAAGAAPDERVLEADLQPGPNALSVVARNGAGESLPAQVAVFYTPTQAVPTERTLYVLAVGVSTYADSQINQQSPLQYADRDAANIGSFYQHQGGGRLCDHVQVTVLRNSQATLQAIQQELASLRGHLRPSDTVIVFLSGHGFYTEHGVYFAPYDLNRADADHTGLAWGPTLRQLVDLPCDNVLLLLDHCYSGGVAVEQERVDASRARGWDPDNEELRALREANLFALTASMPDQKSWEDDAWQDGAFTYALLEALRGKAGTDDGYATLAGVRDYLIARVPALIKAIGGDDQQPKLFYPPTIPDVATRELHLSRVP